MNNTDYGQPMSTAPLAYPSAPPAYPQVGLGYAPATPAVDPGRGLGIAGLVLAIVFNVVGLIVSVVAFRRSKQAGFRNNVALAGIIVGALFTVAALIGGVAAVLAATSLVNTCADLGPGTHVVNGVTYTCG